MASEQTRNETSSLKAHDGRRHRDRARGAATMPVALSVAAGPLEYFLLYPVMLAGLPGPEGRDGLPAKATLTGRGLRTGSGINLKEAGNQQP